jgi:hypothetical protein
MAAFVHPTLRLIPESRGSGDAPVVIDPVTARDTVGFAA